jgi:hypothetical protein
MTKQAEIEYAYSLGRNAALVKLAGNDDGGEDNPKEKPYAGTKAIMDELAKQKEIAKLVGLTPDSLLRSMKAPTYLDAPSLEARFDYDNATSNMRALLNHQNAARLAMLGGAIGGTYLGGEGMRSAALASGGSLLGAMAGGNVGRAAAEAANAYIGDRSRALADTTKGKLITYGGALGGLGGGLAAGKYLS